MRTTFAKLTAILLLVFCFGGQTLSAKVKVKKISYGAWAYYYGPVENKAPIGEGVLTINEKNASTITIKGVFDDATVTDAVVDFEATKLQFKGKVSYMKVAGLFPELHITMSEGEFYHNGNFVGQLNSDVKLIVYPILGDVYSLTARVDLYDTMDSSKKFIDAATKFAGCDTYEVINPDYKSIQFEIDSFSEDELKHNSAPMTLRFANGVEVQYPSVLRETSWTLQNGDYIHFVHGEVYKYKVTLDGGTLENGNLIYRYKNGNSYAGAISEYSFTYTYNERTSYDYNRKIIQLSDLLSYKDKVLEWKDLYGYIKDGTLIYADGMTYKGSFRSTSYNGTDKLSTEAYYDLVEYDASGNAVDKYHYGKSENERIEEERIRAEEERRRAEEERLAMEKRYGKKYVEVARNGKIIAGMHIDLVDLVCKERGGNWEVVRGDPDTQEADCLVYLPGQGEFFIFVSYKTNKVISVSRQVFF